MYLNICDLHWIIKEWKVFSRFEVSDIKEWNKSAQLYSVSLHEETAVSSYDHSKKYLEASVYVCTSKIVAKTPWSPGKQQQQKR